MTRVRSLEQGPGDAGAVGILRSLLNDEPWVRLALVDGVSDKFWRIRRAGKWVEAWWGRNGTDGQRKVWEFMFEGEALAYVQGKTAEKVAKGYREEAELRAEARAAETRGRAAAKAGARAEKGRRAKPDGAPRIGRFVAIRALREAASSEEGEDG